MRVEVLGQERRRRWGDEKKLDVVMSVGLDGATVTEVAHRHDTTLSRRAPTWKPSARRNDDCQPVPGGPLHVVVDSTGLQIYGAGRWLEDKHGAKSRRGWRKLHLALDADSGEIIAHALTEQDVGDSSQMEPLLDQIDAEIGQFTADGAYDGDPSYDAVMRHSAEAFG